MLIKCPECNLQVSDQAISCPHCGYVLNKQIYKRATTRSTRRKRLPNGFGQISKISNKNLKKPYRAMVTIGKNDNGRPICKLLKPVAYFATYNEAYEALLNNAKNPYSIEKEITVQELFDEWMKMYVNTVIPARVITIRSAWKYAHTLYNLRFADIRVRHINSVLLNGQVESKGRIRKIPEAAKKNILLIFRSMYDYAIEYELVNHNYAKDVNTTKKIDNSVIKGHIIFSKDELNTLWNHKDDKYVSMVLIQCYTGWRPSELTNIKLDDINLENQFIVGGMKTDNGKNRIVPICPKIKALVEKQYYQAKEAKSEYLFYYTRYKRSNPQRVSYKIYLNRMKDILLKYNLNQEHTPHDCRKTFVTLAKEYELDEYAIKYIVGHAIKDLTERIYTERTTQWLIDEMTKIQ